MEDVKVQLKSKRKDVRKESGRQRMEIVRGGVCSDPQSCSQTARGGLETGSKCLVERVSDHNGSFRPVRGKRYGYQEEVSRPLVGKNLSLQTSSVKSFKVIQRQQRLKIGRTGRDHRPDQDTLALQPLPQRAVALVGDGEDVRGDFAEVVSAVHLHGRPVVQAGEQLVGVHRRQDGADVRLRTGRENGKC